MLQNKGLREEQRRGREWKKKNGEKNLSGGAAIENRLRLRVRCRIYLRRRRTVDKHRRQERRKDLVFKVHDKKIDY